jgi:class 3 adenylate cyclase/alpha-beta hydrolase superfamily lysophospholipase
LTRFGPREKLSSVRPETRYAKSGDLHIAYQVIGAGGHDLVLVPEFWHSIEAQWEEPSFARFLERLGALGRLICFDQRGTSLSDPVALDELPSLEQWMDDVNVVMDAVGSERATLVGFAGGSLISTLFAATYPERTAGLILVNGLARLVAADDYAGVPTAKEDEIRDEMRRSWGRGALLELVAPSRLGDATFRDWWARYQRIGASPGSVLAVRSALAKMDVRPVLPTIRVPTLVLHRDNRLVGTEHGRYLAQAIPGARYVDLPGPDYFVFLEPAAEIAVREIESFVRGAGEVADAERVLATVLFTDIVGSTRHVTELGDRRWADVLAAHNALVRRELDRFQGREVDTAGDGFFATFDGPARAVRCACAIRHAVASLGLEIRAGLHTGELELADGAPRGVAVHIGQRVASNAEPGEVLATSTVHDLVAGSGIRFDDRGVTALKGVADEWRLFVVDDA